jgi:ABC-type spermidine/putrescine transport system permease subunit II
MRRWVDDIGYAVILGVIGITLVFLIAPIVVSIMMSFDGRG